MQEDTASKRLQILPVEVIEHDDRVILIRGLTQVQIPDKNILIIITVFQRALQQKPMTANDLSALFAAPSRPLILEFIDFLLKKRLMYEYDSDQPHASVEAENSQDVFYWHYNKHQGEIALALNEKVWFFIGVNKLSRKLVAKLSEEGLQNYVVVDDPSLRAASFFNPDGSLNDQEWALPGSRILEPDAMQDYAGNNDIGFIIAATEFGSQFLLRQWNQYSVERNIPFFPVLLQHMTGYAGPLVIPGECACLECLRARQNSNAKDYEERRITEQYAFESQKVAAYHGSMLNVLAEVAAFELIRFRAGMSWDVGTLIEINLLSSEMQKRKLLKAPRCIVCSNVKNHPKINLHKRLASEESWDDINKTVGYNE
jgi:thiazole/oxazole-forming peptide maturase SagC family component